jgi:glutaredoxin 3
MPKVLVYATGICPYCTRARRLLDRKGVEFEEVRVDRDRQRLQEMIRRSNRTTVPQIFIGEHHVGGYDDMAALEEAGRLDLLLRGQGPEAGS